MNGWFTMLNVRVEPETVRAWLDAARSGPARDALEAVYAMTRDAIEARGPACWASGRCCNFKHTGHLLFVTGLEAAYCLLGALDAGADRRALARDLELARVRGDCPFLLANLCGAHAYKPLGCRVYFCDRDATSWQHDLSERMLREVRAIHDREGVEYAYGEWRGMLGAVLGQPMPGTSSR